MQDFGHIPANIMVKIAHLVLFYVQYYVISPIHGNFSAKTVQDCLQIDPIFMKSVIFSIFGCFLPWKCYNIHTSNDS